MAGKHRCPICHKAVVVSDREFPFCSARCRTEDLGNWASGRYVIASPITSPDELTEAELQQLLESQLAEVESQNEAGGSAAEGKRREQPKSGKH